MSWNYRLVRHKEPAGEDYLQIHEVHYDKSGRSTSISVDGARVGGETKKGVCWVLRKMREATAKPILVYSSFSGTETKKRKRA